MNQQLIFEAAELEKYAADLEQHHEFLVKQIAELEHFAENLADIPSIQGKEILASLGKGVHIKTTVTETKLFVEVGAGIVVQKTPEELKQIIEEQLKQLKESKATITVQLGLSTQRLQELLREFERENNSK